MAATPSRAREVEGKAALAAREGIKAPDGTGTEASATRLAPAGAEAS